MTTRNEKVRLELEDHFTKQMIGAAGAAALLKKELNDLSGTAVQSSRNTDKVTKSTKDLGTEVDRTSSKARAGGREIDRFSGRLRLLTEAAVLLGPALVPVGAVGVPAVAALASSLGAAAGAAVLTIVAFNGVGDALNSIDAYQLEPTVANLEKMQAALDDLGPAGADFAKYLDGLDPLLRDLQNLTREGLFPGVESGINDLLTRLPQIQQIVFDLSAAMGDLAAGAGSALAGDRWTAFFDYLETDAAPTLTAFSKSIGNVIEGLGSLIVAFAPLSRDFNAGMEAMSKSFADWAAGLSETDGFRDFVAYVRESGPQVLDLLGALATAFVAIARAAAPVGEAVLPALTAMARLLAIVANSPIGPPLFTAVAAMLALSRATTIAAAAMSKLGAHATTTASTVGKLRSLSGYAVGLLAVGTAVGAIADGVGRIDTENLDRSLTALSFGDVTDEINDVIGSLEELTATRNSVDLGEFVTAGGLFGDSTLDKYADNVEQVDQKLASLVETGQSVLASQMFERIAALAVEQGVSAEDTAKSFDAYAAALSNTKAADTAAGAQKRYTKALQSSARVNGLTRAQVDALNSAMEEQASSALSAFDAITSYREALKAAAAQAKKNDAGIAGNTRAALNNRAALSQLAGAWNSQGDAVRNNMNKWRQARADFIQTAVAMGVPIRKARELANSLLEIPRQRQIDIKLYGSEKAASQIERIRAAVTSIPREWSTTYYVNQVNRINKGPVTGPGSADGTTVPKTGRPYADRHPYLLADGEEVISNRHGQADRHRSILKAINANRFPAHPILRAQPWDTQALAAGSLSRNHDPSPALPWHLLEEAAA